MGLLLPLALLVLLATRGSADRVKEHPSSLEDMEAARTATIAAEAAVSVEPAAPAAAAAPAPPVALTYPGPLLSHRISRQPKYPVKGEKFKVTIEVKNHGLAPFTKGSVSVWENWPSDDKKAACNEASTVQVPFPALKPGEYKTLKVVTLTAPATAGKYKLHIFFDSTCVTWTDPKDQDQDTRTYTVVDTPLISADIAAPVDPGWPWPPTSAETSGYAYSPVYPAPGKDMTFKATLKNNGGVAIPTGMVVSVWRRAGADSINWSGDPCKKPTKDPVATKTVAFNDQKDGGLLKPGASKTFEINVPAGTPAADVNTQAFSYMLLADPDCAILTKDSAPPVQEFTISQPKGEYPWLIPFIQSFTPAKPKAGGKVTMKIGVRNDGSAAGFVGKVAIWNDAAKEEVGGCDPKDATVVDTTHVNTQLAPGEVVIFGVQVTVVSEANVWRRFAVHADAECANKGPNPNKKKAMRDDIVKPYKTKP